MKPPPATGTPPANASPPSTDTMTVSPGYVPASSVTTLVFTYTAAEYILRRDISLTIPSGWTAPSYGGPDGGITVACAQPRKYCDLDSQPVSIAGQQVTVGVSYLNAGQSLTITYSHATTPGAAMTYAFDALERSQANMVGKLPSVEITPWTPVTPSPTVTVTCADGTGTVGVSPVVVPAAGPTQLTFTYTAPSCAVNDATVTLTVPGGWTPPSAVSGLGHVSISLSSASLSISGPTITVAGVTLAAGQAFSLTYDRADPPAATTYTFAATERSAPAGTLTGLLSSPK